jgi:hypothetical protein
MIRRTQSLAIREIKIWMEDHSHDVLYTDQPGSSRGGIGDRANLNLAFEHLYDRTPDIVAIDDDNNLGIVEVDKRLDNDLIEKFELYHSKRNALLERLEGELDREITGLIFGFGTWNTAQPEADIQYDPFYRFYLREEDARAVRV